MNFPLYSILEPGSMYRNWRGRLVKTKFQSKLVYQWGKKGTSGMDPTPFYYVPILGGHVGIYVSPEKFTLHVVDKPNEQTRHPMANGTGRIREGESGTFPCQEAGRGRKKRGFCS